jgi:hypothetical protein
MWRSQTLANDYQGGYLVVLPGEAFQDWAGRTKAYAELCEMSAGPVDYLTVGSRFAVLVAAPEGDVIDEAWWRRDYPGAPLMLAAWSNWGLEDRDQWLTERLEEGDLEWERHAEPLVVESGRLVLFHGEDPASKVTEAPTNRNAVCGESVPVEVDPGTYRVETAAEIQEWPEGSSWIVLCRFVPAS